MNDQQALVPAQTTSSTTLIVRQLSHRLFYLDDVLFTLVYKGVVPLGVVFPFSQKVIAKRVGAQSVSVINFTRTKTVY